MKKEGFILRPVFLRLWIEKPGFGTMIPVVVFYMDVGDLGSNTVPPIIRTENNSHSLIHVHIWYSNTSLIRWRKQTV